MNKSSSSIQIIKFIWLIFFSILYTIYFLIGLYFIIRKTVVGIYMYGIMNIFNTFFYSFSPVDLPYTISFMIPPLMIYFIWKNRNKMLMIDYHMFYIPSISWYGLYVLLGIYFNKYDNLTNTWRYDKSLSNLMFEFPIVILLTEIYYFRLTLSNKWKVFNSKITTYSIVAIIVLITFLMVQCVPHIGE